MLSRLDIQNDWRVASFDQTVGALILQLTLWRAFLRPLLILFDPEETVLHCGTQPSFSNLLIYHEREQLHERHLLLE